MEQHLPSERSGDIEKERRPTRKKTKVRRRRRKRRGVEEGENNKNKYHNPQVDQLVAHKINGDSFSERTNKQLDMQRNQQSGQA